MVEEAILLHFNQGRAVAETLRLKSVELRLRGGHT